MSQDFHYDILSEPLQIGSVTAKNRFDQEPHCTNIGYLRPRMLAEMRATNMQENSKKRWISINRSNTIVSMLGKTTPWSPCTIEEAVLEGLKVESVPRFVGVSNVLQI